MRRSRLTVAEVMRILWWLRSAVWGWGWMMVFGGLTAGDSLSAADLRFGGLCYSPYRDGQSPVTGVLPTVDEIKEDLQRLKPLTPAVRTYGLFGSMARIPVLAKSVGLRCLAGGWIDGVDAAADEAELERLGEVARKRQAAGVIVGSEVLLRGNLTSQGLVAAIRRVREVAKVPVGSAETWSLWLQHPEVAAECDFLLVHIHPYWEGVAVEEAAAAVMERWRQVADAFPGKAVWIGETGWPSAGPALGAAVPGVANQATFLRDFVVRALREGAPYFLFEAMDENWKVAGGLEVEAHWGIHTANRVLKPDVAALVKAPGPLIEITTPAPDGAGPNSKGTMAGAVYGVAESERNAYQVVVYAGTDRWYVQPTVTSPFTRLQGNSTWHLRTHLGHDYAALLVRKGFQPPAVTDALPPLGPQVVACCTSAPAR